MRRIRVEQHYRYDYVSPVTDLRQRLVLLPPAVYGDQRLLDGAVHVDGVDDAAIVEEQDAHGNRVHRIDLAAIKYAVEFSALYTVERAEPRPVRITGGVGPYLIPTPLTSPSAGILVATDAVATRAATILLPSDVMALGIDARRQWALAIAVAEWTADTLEYRVGVTDVHTTAAIALDRRAGVCQDFTHVALAVLRVLGVPARYVSGHLLGEGAPHAWFDALLPNPDDPATLVAIPFDPIHRSPVWLDYVTVAVGRDYADVAPTSGTFVGIGPGTLTPRKDAWIVRAEVA